MKTQLIAALVVVVLMGIMLMVSVNGTTAANVNVLVKEVR